MAPASKIHTWRYITRHNPLKTSKIHALLSCLTDHSCFRVHQVLRSTYITCGRNYYRKECLHSLVQISVLDKQRSTPGHRDDCHRTSYYPMPNPHLQCYLYGPLDFKSDAVFYMLDPSGRRNPVTNPHKSGSLSTKRTDVLLQDPVKPRNHEILVYTFPILLTFDRHFSGSAAEMPIEC